MNVPPITEQFVHEEPDRRIVFGPGAAVAALAAAGQGYVLLTTERALIELPEAADAAAHTEFVAHGRVDEVAGELLSVLGPDAGEVAVALGGGRVIDTAKALAGAGVTGGVIALPTTLSAAEMTGFHRPALGAPPGSRFVRPRLVGNDPALSASQPHSDLAASTANSIGHALAAATTPHATPITAAVARSALEQLTAGWAGEEPDRARLALGALLAGWAVGFSGLGLHHALAQTVVREQGIAHGYGNLALLPVSLAWLDEHHGATLAWLETTLPQPLAEFAARLKSEAGVTGLAALGVSESDLAAIAESVAQRRDVAALTPDATAAVFETFYREAM